MDEEKTLTKEERARMEAWLAAHPYGEQDENGIDLSLLRRNLKLTPTQRLERSAFGPVLCALRQTGIPFVLSGGMALCIYGSAYVLSGVEIFFPDTSENRERLQSIRGLTFFNTVPPMPPSFAPVQTAAVPTSEEDFARLLSRSVQLSIQGHPLHLVSLAEIIKEKRIANRLQEQNIIMELLALQKLITQQER